MSGAEQLHNMERNWNFSDLHENCWSGLKIYARWVYILNLFVHCKDCLKKNRVKSLDAKFIFLVGWNEKCNQKTIMWKLNIVKSILTPGCFFINAKFDNIMFHTNTYLGNELFVNRAYETKTYDLILEVEI